MTAPLKMPPLPVRLTTLGRTVYGAAIFYSPNKHSMMVEFDGMLGGYVGMIPLLFIPERGIYKDLITGTDCIVDFALHSEDFERDETDAGSIAERVRALLKTFPDASAAEVSIAVAEGGAAEAEAEIRALLTPEENARLKVTFLHEEKIN